MSDQGQPWETEDGWEFAVTRPVILHAMAPRHAAAILAEAGRAMDRGYSVEEVLRRIRSVAR